MARRRGLTSEERELWSRIARSAAPLKQRPSIPFAPAEPVSQPVKAAPKPPIAAFRLGQTATKPAPIVHHAPTPAERLAMTPLRMDHKTHKRLKQGKLRPEARLDLHGMTLAVAHPELMQFILSCHAGGLRLALVITGKGKGDHGPLPTRSGALRHQVPHWLHMPPLSAVVQQVTPAHDRHGGTGAYYVYLRRRP